MCVHYFKETMLTAQFMHIFLHLQYTYFLTYFTQRIFYFFSPIPVVVIFNCFCMKKTTTTKKNISKIFFSNEKNTHKSQQFGNDAIKCRRFLSYSHFGILCSAFRDFVANSLRVLKFNEIDLRKHII